MPATPDAGIVWLIIDLTVPSAQWGRPPLRVPKTSVSAWISVTSPTGVAVPCASSSPIVDGATPAFAYARRSASTSPSTRGAITLTPRPSLATPTPRITA